MHPYIDLNYVDRMDEVEAMYEATLKDIEKDPHFYAELVNDLMFHWVYGTRETVLMNLAKKGLTSKKPKVRIAYGENEK